jgi:hypothetical protein
MNIPRHLTVGMKTKDNMLKVIKKWNSDIADIRHKHDLVVVMRNNAGENKSHEIMEFQSTGARNHFSSSYEQWQNGLAEAAINSIMRLARTVMAESGLGGRFWFKAALAGKDTRNVTYKQRLGQTPHSCIYCELKVFHASALSDAGYGFISMRKGGRRVSTHQERKKQSILDLSPIPAHGHSSFQKGKHCGQRTKRSSTSMCFLFAREVSSTSSKGITRLIFFSRLRRISSGLLTIACT